MKRILCILLALISIASIAIAEDMDFSAYTTDQLVDMAALIQTEINARTSSSESPIPSGHYEVGVNMKAGKYELSVPSDDKYMDAVYVKWFSMERAILSLSIMRLFLYAFFTLLSPFFREKHAFSGQAHAFFVL